MMVIRKLASVLLLFLTVFELHAQDTLEVKELRPVKAVKEGIFTVKPVKDNPLGATMEFERPSQERVEIRGTTVNQNNAQVLGDYQLPATYDSLWLEELSRSHALYPEMAKAVNAAEDEPVDLSGWDTEEFKTRLQAQ